MIQKPIERSALIDLSCFILQTFLWIKFQIKFSKLIQTNPNSLSRSSKYHINSISFNQFSSFNSKQEKHFSYGQNGKRRILEIIPIKSLFFMWLTNIYICVYNSTVCIKTSDEQNTRYRENTDRCWMLTILRLKTFHIENCQHTPT